MKKNQKMVLTALCLFGLTACGFNQEEIKDSTVEVEEGVEVSTETLETSPDSESEAHSSLENEEADTNHETEVTEDITSRLDDNVTTIEDLSLVKTLIQEKASFFLVISAKTCGDCAFFQEETLNHYSKEEVGLHLVKLEWTALTNDEKEEIRAITELGIEVTPTTFLFRDGEVILKREDSLTINELKKLVHE